MKPDIRKAILAEMNRRGMTGNALALAVAGQIHRSHVYDFLAGRKELTTDKANHLLAALKLRIAKA